MASKRGFDREYGRIVHFEGREEEERQGFGTEGSVVKVVEKVPETIRMKGRGLRARGLGKI